MNQALILAEMLMIKNFRSRLPVALLLLLLPFLLAIWLIHSHHPGLQAIFAKDIGLAFVNLASLTLMLVFALENLIWSGKSAFFLVCRVRRPMHLFLGQFLGIGFSIMACLTGIATILYVFFRVVYGSWLHEILFSSYFILLESLVLLSAMILLSRLMSKFLASAAMILLYIFANSSMVQVLNSSLAGENQSFVVILVMSLIPDFSMFSYSGLILEQQVLHSQEALVSSFYAVFMISFYLVLAEIMAQRRKA